MLELRRDKFDKLLHALHQHPSALASEELRMFLAPIQLVSARLFVFAGGVVVISHDFWCVLFAGRQTANSNSSKERR